MSVSVFETNNNLFAFTKPPRSFKMIVHPLIRIGLSLERRMILNPFRGPTFCQRGSALLMTIFFLAFSAAVIVAVGSVVDQKQGTILRAKIMDSRSFVMTSVLRNARTATYYYRTLTQPAPGLDPRFKDCMIGDGVVPACIEGGPYPLLLIDDSAAGIPVIGPNPNQAVHYDIYGRVCFQPDRDLCVFEAWAEYVTKCPRSGSPCFQAATIEVTVSLKPISSIYPSQSLELPVMTANETVSISNFVDFSDPAFPPVVRVQGAPNNSAIGAPISGNAGPGRMFPNYVLPFSSTGLCIDSYSCSGSCVCIYTGPMGGGGGGGGAPPVPSVGSCPAGMQSVGGSCAPFHF